MKKLEVVKVINKDSDCGYMLINKADLKPEHELFEDKPKKNTKKAQPKKDK